MFWNQENLLESRAGDAETEALQTDVLRFLAILGFCLMAVFALVQAIPVTSDTRGPLIESLKKRIESQNAEIAQLKKENERLKAAFASAKAAVREEEKEQDLRKAFGQALARLEEMRERLSGLERENLSRETNEENLRRRLEERSRAIKRVQEEKAELEELLREKAADAAKVSAPKPKPEPQPDTSEDRAEPKKEGGLYVAFASDGVFLDLLRAGRIKMFIRIVNADQVFQVSHKGGEFDFSTGSPAGGLDLWELGEDTVPDSLLKAFSDWTTLASKKKMLIVGLPSDISRQIRSRVSEGGRLIIMSGGKVRREE